MSAVTKGFFDRMNGDGTLVALLGTYKTAPSIFTKRPLPPGFDIEAHGPYVLTTGEAVQDPGPADVKNSKGREIVRDILCFSKLSDSATVVEEVAEQVRFLFQRQVFSITGFSIIVAEVSGPIEADEDDALGRVVSVRLVLKES